jgi:hypothetical protein
MITFERTSIFCKEDGLKRMLPYELITFDGHPFFGFAPAILNRLAGVTINTDIIDDFDDYQYDDDVLRPEFDKIIGEVNVDSEAVFIGMSGNVNGYYDSRPSTEFGYPR